MLTKVVTAPSVEPVTLSEVKDHLRIDHMAQDSMLEGLIQASREWVEQITGRALVEQTRAARFASWPMSGEFVLPYPPLRSVSSLVYTDTSGSESTFSSDNYTVLTNREPGKLVLGYNKVWPSVTLHAPEMPITITYECGYASEGSPADYRANVPEAIKNVIKLDVERRYDRPPEGYAERLDKVIDILLAPYRVWGFE